MDTIPQKTNTLVRYYLRLVALYVLYFISLSVLSTYIPELISDKYEQTFLQELLAEKPLQLFFLAVLFAPILEEMMFRTLLKPSHSDIILFLCAWPVYYLNGYLPQNAHWFIKLIFIAIFLFVVFYMLRELISDNKTARLRHFLSSHYKLVLVVSSFLFGLIHINNYVEDFIINAALVALIIPRVLAGFMMGFIKLENRNISWSMGLHAINNGVVIGLLLLAKNHV